jgi:succinoglycan biosynthesis transport protein ExoP
MKNETENLPAIFDPSTALAQNQPIWSTDAGADKHDDATPVAHYLWLIRRHAWKIGVFALTSLVITYLISSRLQPIYESTVGINIDRQAPSGVIGEDAQKMSYAPQDADEYIATQIKIIQSDPVLRPVARKFNLLEREKRLEGLTPREAAAIMAAPTVLKRIKVVRPTSTYLVMISYRSTDSQLSADVANAIAKSYLEHIYRLQVSSATNASGFMAKQIDELRARMERSGQALAQFEKELNVINPEEKTNIVSQRLLQLNTEYTAAQADRVKNEAAYNSIASGSLEAAQASGQGEALQRLQEHINDAEEKFAEIRSSKGPNHPDYKRQQMQLQELQAQFQTLRTNIAQRVEVEYRKSVAREQMLQNTLSQTKAEADQLNLHSFDYQRLKQEADADKKLYEQLMTRNQEATINAGFQNKNTAISDPARPGSAPVFPNTPLNLALATMVSVILGMGMVILLDSFDTTIRDPEQIHRLYQTDLVGTLPVVKDSRSLVSMPLEPNTAESQSLVKPEGKQARSMSSFEEAIRMLRNSILLSDVNRRLRTILITSATPGEGKSTVALHLAIAHADQGKKTLLIDADLRRPTLDKKLGITDAGPGLGGVMLGHAALEEAIVQLPTLPNLHLLPAGAPSRRACDLIGGIIADLLDEAVQIYDFVILDAPPMLGFAEPMQLAIAVDGVVVIAVAGETNRKAITSVVSTLRRLKANLLGIILNRLSNDTGSGYYYYRYYDYYRASK